MYLVFKNCLFCIKYAEIKNLNRQKEFAVKLLKTKTEQIIETEKELDKWIPKR